MAVVIVVVGAGVSGFLVGKEQLRSKTAGSMASTWQVQNSNGNQEVQWTPRFLQILGLQGGLVVVTYLWPEETVEGTKTKSHHLHLRRVESVCRRLAHILRNRS